MYLKNGVIIAYSVNIYLLLVIVFGQHGVVDIFQERGVLVHNRVEYIKIIETNRVNLIKVSLINADIVDLRYLEELLRIQYSMIKADERVIISNPSLKKLKSSNKSVAVK